MRIRLFDSAYNPVTGVAQASMTVTLMKPDGSVQALTAAAGTNGFTWTETTTGAFSGKGLYQLVMTSDLFAAEGEYTVACSGGTGGAVSEFSCASAFASTVQTRLGTPANASVSADIAAVQSTASSTLSAASTASSQASAANTAATLARKMATNKAIQTNNQYVVYDDNGTSPLKTFDTKDSSGNPTNTSVFERVPNP